MFCGVSLSGDLFDVLYWVYGFGEDEVKCHSHHIISRIHATNTVYDH